jgi:hypothetical protein
VCNLSSDIPNSMFTVLSQVLNEFACFPLLNYMLEKNGEDQLDRSCEK